MKVKLEHVCRRGSSNLMQKEVIALTGAYPIFGAAGQIGTADFYHQGKPYVAIVKDGAGIGRTMLLPAFSSVIGTLQYLIPNEKVLPEYLCYVVQHMNLAKYFSGATIPHIYFRDYKNEEFNLESLDKQREIVSILNRIKRIISCRQNQLAKLDELVKCRFVEMFIGKGYPRRELQSLIQDGTSISYGIVQPGDDGTGNIGLLRPVDFHNGSVVLDNLKYIGEAISNLSRKTILEGNELLITVRGTTGLTALTNSNHRGMNVTRGIAVVKYDGRKIVPEYLQAFMSSDESQTYIREHTRGATLQQINLSDLRIQSILVPPFVEQQTFADFVSLIDKLRVAVQASLDKTQQLFDSLMQEYFG